MDTMSDPRRTRIDGLLEVLSEAGIQITNPKSFCCPFHDDHSPSATISADQAGIYRFKCWACEAKGDYFDIKARLKGVNVEELFRAETGRSQYTKSDKVQQKHIYNTLRECEDDAPGIVEDVHLYKNNLTKAIDLAIVRFTNKNGKQFWPFRSVLGGFVREMVPGKRPLYHQPEIAESETVTVVEGEKCVDALARRGIVATTSPGGARVAHLADWSPLAGRKVVIWPDNDQNGIHYAESVSNLLRELRPRPEISVLDPSHTDLPPKGDAADLIEEGWTQDDLLGLLAKARANGPADVLRRHLEAARSGERSPVFFPWKILSEQTRALLPGTLTILCGAPGATKSLFMLQSMIHWYREGIETAMLALEEPLEHHLNRLMAQLEEDSSCANEEWHIDHPGESREIFAKHEHALHELGFRIATSDEGVMKHKDVLAWVEKQCEAGVRILIVDPITVVSSVNKQWIADNDFVVAAKKIIAAHGASLILVTHPPKGGSKISEIDNLAGGAAYSRFSQTIIAIEYHLAKTVNIDGNSGILPEIVNRTVVVLKARNACGGQRQIGFYFDGAQLLAKEVGLIVAKRKGETL